MSEPESGRLSDWHSLQIRSAPVRPAGGGGGGATGPGAASGSNGAGVTGSAGGGGGDPRAGSAVVSAGVPSPGIRAVCRTCPGWSRWLADDHTVGELADLESQHNNRVAPPAAKIAQLVTAHQPETDEADPRGERKLCQQDGDPWPCDVRTALGQRWRLIPEAMRL